MPRILVLGGGASGLAGAIALGRRVPDADIHIYEKLSEPAKKILATGNGRCNLGNRDIDISRYHGDSSTLALVLRTFSADDCVDFFHSLGLLIREEEGRLYPYSLNASSVRDVLLGEVKNLGIHVHTDTRIETVEETGNGFLVNGNIRGDYVLFCIGGKAAAPHGTDGDGYRILKSLGIRYAPISPALVQLKTGQPEDLKTVKRLKGVRAKSRIVLHAEDGGIRDVEDGELLFTDYGVSGIAVMQLSGDAIDLLKEEKPYLTIDFCPELPDLQLLSYLQDCKTMRPDGTAETLLLGLLNRKIAREILLRAAVSPDLPARALTVDNIARIVEQIKGFRLNLTGNRGFKEAQVTRGGVMQGELKDGTLESRTVPHLYFAGELLNVDGICGGYNLHFAWGSGIEAAKEIAADIRTD